MAAQAPRPEEVRRFASPGREERALFEIDSAAEADLERLDALAIAVVLRTALTSRRKNPTRRAHEHRSAEAGAVGQSHKAPMRLLLRTRIRLQQCLFPGNDVDRTQPRPRSPASWPPRNRTPSRSGTSTPSTTAQTDNARGSFNRISSSPLISGPAARPKDFRVKTSSGALST